MANTVPGGAIPLFQTQSSNAGNVSVSLGATSGNRTVYLTGFSFQGSNATAAQTGSIAVFNVYNGTGSNTGSFAYPTLASGAAIPQPGPLTITFSPAMPATGPNTQIVINGAAFAAGATINSINAWGYAL